MVPSTLGTIQPSIGLYCLSNECLHFDGLGHVSPDRDGFPTVFRDHMHNLLSPIGVQVSHNQFRPFPRANVRAVARPIPDAPPGTNATLPSTRPAMWRSPVYTYRHRLREDTILRLG